MSNKLNKSRRNINYVKPVEMYTLGIKENFQTNEQFGGSLNGEVADFEFACQSSKKLLIVVISY